MLEMIGVGGLDTTRLKAAGAPGPVVAFPKGVKRIEKLPTAVGVPEILRTVAL
jgi:hypothetical protein